MASIYWQTKYFGKPFAVCLGKVCVPLLPSAIQLGSSSATRRKSFYNGENTLKIFLNPVRATRTDICDTIDFWKEEVFTLTEVAAPK